MGYCYGCDKEYPGESNASICGHGICQRCLVNMDFPNTQQFAILLRDALLAGREVNDYNILSIYREFMDSTFDKIRASKKK